MTDNIARETGSVTEDQPHLRLFVAGDEPRSRVARANLAALCEQEVCEESQCEIIDVFEDYNAAAEHNILVTPTLQIQRQGTLTNLIGDLSDREEVRRALRI